MVVPYNTQLLLLANSKSVSANASPFVVAIKLAGIKVLPGILNGCILLFVFSAATSDLYIGARTIYGLAVEGLAPAFLQRTNKSGVPVYCVLCCALFACIGFLNVSTGSAVVFTYFTNLVTVFGMLTWVSLLVTHTFFRRACRAQKVEGNNFRYKAPLGLWASYFGIFAITILILIKNFGVFVDSRVTGGKYGRFDYKNFITGYLGIPNFYPYARRL